MQRSVPEIVERKRMLQGVGKKIQAACFDVEFALGYVISTLLFRKWFTICSLSVLSIEVGLR